MYMGNKTIKGSVTGESWWCTKICYLWNQTFHYAENWHQK